MKWESILDSPDEPNVIKRDLKSKEPFLAVVRERCDDGRVRGATLKRKGPQAKECGQHLEDKKGKGTNFPLEPPERNTAMLII